jgi:hypothetical protein
MYQRIREFIETRIRHVMTALVGSVVVIWIASQFIAPLSDWLRAENLLIVVVLALVGEALTSLIELKQQIVARNVRIFSSQKKACDDLLDFIQQNKPTTIDLIEVSTTTIESFLESLTDAECQIRLLMQNPDSGINENQKSRIRQRIVDLMIFTFEGYKQWEIRLYTAPCSIRGRLVGEEIVSIGWYTYSPDRWGVHGHDNPLVTAYVESPEGHALHKMFVRAFNWLWEDPRTITLDEYIKMHPDLQIDSA